MVLAHLIGEYFQKQQGGDSRRLAQAVIGAVCEVIGTYGLAVMSTKEPDIVVGARGGSPLIIGIGDGERRITQLYAQTTKLLRPWVGS